MRHRLKMMAVICVVLFGRLSRASSSSSSSESNDKVRFHALPGLPDVRYSQLGDINIGAFLNVVEKSSTKYYAEICSDRFKTKPFTVEMSEAIAFAVGLINNDHRILPNVTLGFVIEGICSVQGISLGTSLNFLPRSQLPCSNGTHCSGRDDTPPANSPWLGHDVIGVLTVGTSRLTVPISRLYAVGQLPMMGAVETSDELSRKLIHPYFFRLVPPDLYQIHGVLTLLSSNEWSYISVIYHDGDYGQNAFDKIKQFAGSYGICIATSHRLIAEVDYDEVAADLILNFRARVVVVFTFPPNFRQVLQAVANKNATGHFIWVGGDALGPYRGYDYKGLDFDPAVGMFVFSFNNTYVPEFYDYLRQQNVLTTKNPWMKPIWEWLFDCSFADGTCDANDDIMSSSRYFAYSSTALRIDVVMTFAQAAHNLLTERCPGSTGADARSCITSELLKEYLQNVSVEGYSGRIEFDENQEVRGKYAISQLVYDFFRYPFAQPNSSSSNAGDRDKRRVFGKRIKMYDSATGAISDLNETVSWSHVDTLDRLVPRTTSSSNSNLLPVDMPESVCSRPCLVGEYKIEKEVPCCWDCVRCRENEYLTRGGNTSCDACPPFMWPDASTAFTSCVDIPVTFPLFADTIPIAFVCLASLALIITLATCAAYFLYRNQRVIKASSRELSVIQLVAILVGYTTVILFQTTPTETMCGAIFFFFCMSFALLYCPLLVKTARIFRIFRSGVKNERPRWISSQSQLVLAFFLIAIQVSLCTTTYILYGPGAQRTQPIWSEKFVELACDLTFPGLASFLGYNIVLVSLCSVFAFMVRKLPDNFNESKFISMCVSTTLLIWLAFIPTYFTADRAFVRTFLMSVALLLNHSVALLFLFSPKIYAAMFLSPDASDFSAKQS